MKASIASIWVVGLVVTFILIFSAYIIITVDYSSTYQMKNDILSIIEKNKGFTVFNGTDATSKVVPGVSIKKDVGSLRTINAYLANSNYRAKGTCDPEADISNQKWIGVKELRYDNISTGNYGNILEYSPSEKKSYYYCVSRFRTGRVNEYYSSAFYEIQLFYKFEIPVLRVLLPVRVVGITDEIYVPAEDIFTKKWGSDFPKLYG